MTEKGDGEGLKANDKGDHGYMWFQSMWMGAFPHLCPAGLLEARKSMDGLT